MEERKINYLGSDAEEQSFLLKRGHQFRQDLQKFGLGNETHLFRDLSAYKHTAERDARYFALKKLFEEYQCIEFLRIGIGDESNSTDDDSDKISISSSLGDMFDNSDSVDKVPDLADIALQEWTDRAQELFDRGYRYENGDRVFVDMKMAVEYYQSAANMAHAEAQYRLGNCYEEGKGIEKNLEIASDWYKRAAAAGYVLAATALITYHSPSVSPQVSDVDHILPAIEHSNFSVENSLGLSPSGPASFDVQPETQVSSEIVPGTQCCPSADDIKRGFNKLHVELIDHARRINGCAKRLAQNFRLLVITCQVLYLQPPPPMVTRSPRRSTPSLISLFFTRRRRSVMNQAGLFRSRQLQIDSASDFCRSSVFDP